MDIQNLGIKKLAVFTDKNVGSKLNSAILSLPVTSVPPPSPPIDGPTSSNGDGAEITTC